MKLPMFLLLLHPWNNQFSEDKSNHGITILSDIQYTDSVDIKPEVPIENSVDPY